MATGWILLVVMVVLLGVAAILYNRLISLRNAWTNAFSQIDVQLQRRHELIPNLVEIASRYLKHEQQTLLAVTEARNTAASRRQQAAASPGAGGRISGLAGAEQVLNGALGQLNLVMEDYPELKADVRLGELQAELASTENRVAFARQAFSDAAMRYNVAREQFPGNLVAGVFSFARAELYEIDNVMMRQAVRVSFA